MRDVIRLIGLVLTLQGVSGAIDHLALQPYLGLFLNLFNRVVVPRFDLLADNALLANLALAALGAVLLLAAHRPEPSEGRAAVSSRPAAGCAWR